MAFVFGIIIKKRRARDASSDAITTLGLIKLFLYDVNEVKVSNHHGLAKIGRPARGYSVSQHLSHYT